MKDLTELALKWKGKVSTQFIECLPYFEAGKSHKAGWDCVVWEGYESVLKVIDFEVARLSQVIPSALLIRWNNKPSTKNRAKVVAEYFGLSWYDVAGMSIMDDGVCESLHVLGTSVSPISTEESKPKVTPVTITSAIEDKKSGKVTLTFEIKKEKYKAPAYHMSIPPTYTPDPTDERMMSLWGLYTKMLLPEAADFYLLAEAGENAKWVQFHYYSHARRLAELVAGYLAMAIGGELRHAMSKSAWMKGLSKGSRRRAWESWKGIWEELGPSVASQKAAYSFRASRHFRGGYGGEPWAKAAEILGQWYSGDLSDVLFVDTTMQLQHNCGCIFNKWFLDLTNLKDLLDAKFRGNHETLLGYATPTVRRIFLNTMPKDKVEMRRKWAKRFNVERVMEV